jgi:effector-binding domain-containing protein
MEAPQPKHIDAQIVACIAHTGAYSDIGSVYRRLGRWTGEAGVEPVGPAFTVFLEHPGDINWDAGSFEVCLPVPDGTAGSDEVAVKRLPPVDVLAVVVEGPYEHMAAHYSEFLAWVAIEGTAVAGPPREIYLVHPGPDGSGDPASFRTEIQFPVE